MYSPNGSNMNRTGIVQWVLLDSFTKDSIHLQWGVDKDTQSVVTGYKIRYQAIGSHVIQFSPLLGSTRTGYDIAKLHEDTNYDVCVQVFANSTQDSIIEKCIQASTSTSSLTMALGSTFGAFLALGIIVMFVFLAKWQHQRRQRKLQLQAPSPSEGSYDSMIQGEGDYEMSDVSLQVHEDKLALEFSSQSSQAQSMTANGTLHHHIPPDIEEDEEDDDYTDVVEGSVTVHEPPDSGQDSDISPDGDYPPMSSSNDGEAINVAIGGESPIEPVLEPFPYTQNQDGRPPDVRPKDKALLDLTHMYANKKLFEQPQSQLRPNMSCNW